MMNIRGRLAAIAGRAVARRSLQPRAVAGCPKGAPFGDAFRRSTSTTSSLTSTRGKGHGDRGQWEGGRRWGGRQVWWIACSATVLGSLAMDSNFRKGALAESARARRKKEGGKGGSGGGGGSDKNSNDMSHLKRSLLDVEEQRKGLRLGSMVEKIASLINTLVDMDFFSEEEEQEIFEHSVVVILSEIEQTLPKTFLEVVLDAREQGMDDDVADKLRHRLDQYVKSRVQLPYLDETDEARVVSSVVAVVVECMKTGQNVDTVCEPRQSAELILDVFVKGTVGFLDEHNKKAVIQDIGDDFLNVPFVPDRFKHWVIGYAVDAVGECFESSIRECYHRRTTEAEMHAKQRVDDAGLVIKELSRSRVGSSVLSILRTQPLGVLTSKLTAANPLPKRGPTFDEEGNLKYLSEGPEFAKEVRDTLVDKLNERIDIIGWMGSYADHLEGYWIGELVDLTLIASMEIDKMDEAVKALLKEHYMATLQTAWENQLHDKLRRPWGHSNQEWTKAVAKALAQEDLACPRSP